MTRTKHIMSEHSTDSDFGNLKSEIRNLKSDARDSELQQIREALAGLRFGSVTIVVQDGVVVQIDRTEKKRLQRRNVSASGACS
jgi:hypothetical protein